MLAITHSATLQGVTAVSVTVETNGGEKGEPRCVLVGLPDAAVRSLWTGFCPVWQTLVIRDREPELQSI